MPARIRTDPIVVTEPIAPESIRNLLVHHVCDDDIPLPSDDDIEMMAWRFDLRRRKLIEVSIWRDRAIASKKFLDALSTAADAIDDIEKSGTVLDADELRVERKDIAKIRERLEFLSSHPGFQLAANVKQGSAEWPSFINQIHTVYSFYFKQGNEIRVPYSRKTKFAAFANALIPLVTGEKSPGTGAIEVMISRIWRQAMLEPE